MSNVTSTPTQTPPLKAAIIPVTPLQQNCTLFWCTETNKGALVDPGGDLDKLKAAVAQTGVELEKLLVTHGHLDHCGQAGMLAQELGLKIEGPHEDDRFWIEKLDGDGARYGMEAHSFEPDRWLVDGDIVTVGKSDARCHPLPRPHAWARHFPSPTQPFGDCGGCIVSRVHRSHRFPARQPCRPDQCDHDETVAIGG